MNSILIRFTDSKYADSYRSGNLSFSSLYSFWDLRRNKIPYEKAPFASKEELLKAANDKQQDFSEGISLEIPSSILAESKDFYPHICNDTIRARIDAYGYCKLLCFYRVDITGSVIQNLPSEMFNFGNTVIVVKDEKEFVEQLKAQYELQCEKDNTDDKKELLEAKRRMMDLDDLIKGLYDNFTLGRLPERQFNRLMTEYDTEQSSLEQRISELETATERISTKAVQIDKFVRLVKKYRDFEELTTPMLNDFIEKVVIHEAEGGRTKDRTQQVDIYFNFIGNFVLPLSEDEVEALQSEEARRAEEIAERKRKSSKKSTQKRNQKHAEIKAKAEAGDPEAMAEYKAILEKGRQNNRKRSEKMRELRMSDPEYRAKMEEKERLALEREKKRQERATKKKKIALAE